jgi:hypothetical protein
MKIIEFVKQNWATIFSGIGTAIVVAIIEGLRRSKNRHIKNENLNRHTVKQSAKAGDGSKVIQAGRDANIGSE